MHETFSPPLKPRKVQASYRVGDLAYWALSHDLAIFDADDRQTMPGSGTVIIGRIDSGLDAIADAAPFSSPSKPRLTTQQLIEKGTTMNPRYDFTGQVAVVTGGSSGMGLATAEAFAAAGAAVVLADVNEDALRAATDDMTLAGLPSTRCGV